jgi:isochorismate pyruvate lyase
MDADTLLTVQHCETMVQVRSCIDAIDEQVVALLAARSAYIAQAARIKQRADQIVDLERVEYIVHRMRDAMTARAAPPDIAEATYRSLIGASIAFEQQEFARLRAGERP